MRLNEEDSKRGQRIARGPALHLSKSAYLARISGTAFF